MGIEENKEVVRRYCELYSQHDVDAANELLSPSCFEGDSGWEQNKQLDIMLVNAFPDIKMTISDMIAEGDKVAGIRTMTGTHTGEPFMGIPATGNKIDGESTLIVRIADNKVVEVKGTRDMLGFWQQLGVLPAIPEAIQAYKKAHDLE
jgi:predicted ester cyclase